jgi:acetyl esterase/lipase
VGAVIALAVVALKKFDPFAARPDRVISYREVDGHPLRLHLFEAKGRGDPAGRPLLLLFHGGAWQYGGPQQFFAQCRFFARHGLSCVSAEYRIGSRHGTDARAAVQDARAAFAYLADNASALGIDPRRILAGGGSSGGHLAAALGTALSLPTEPGFADTGRRPAALVLYNPMLDLGPCTPDHHLVKDFWQQVSPLRHIDSRVPPTLILLGDRDPEVPVTTGETFCDAVAAQGGVCELEVYQGARHGFFNQRRHDPNYFELTNQRVLRFVRERGLLGAAD